MMLVQKVAAALKAENCKGLPPSGYYERLAQAAIAAMRDAPRLVRPDLPTPS